MARVSCPSVSSGSLGISLPLVCPCLPYSHCLRVWEFITLVGPFSPYSHCFGVCFAQEETCVMRPWHHQAAKLLVYFLTRINVRHRLLCLLKITRWVFVLLRPRVRFSILLCQSFPLFPSIVLSLVWFYRPYLCPWDRAISLAVRYHLLVFLALYPLRVVHAVLLY